MTLSAARQSQFIRCAQLVVLPADGGKLEIANLTGSKAIRIAFDVTRSFDPTDNTPNDASIRIFNLAENTRKIIEGQKGLRAPVPASWSKAQLLSSDADRNYDGPDAIAVPDPEPLPGIELPPLQSDASHKFGYAYVKLSAGYGGKVGQIFEGTMVVPRSRKIDAVTWMTTIQAGDGSLGAAKGVANTSFPAGTATLTVIRHLIRLLGVGTGNLDEATWLRILAAGQQQAGKPFSTSSTISYPYSPAGASAWRDLSLLLETSNVKWVIDQGEFYLLEPDGYVLGEPIDMGRPIGPVEDLGGGFYKATFLLNKLARPAGRMRLDSRTFKGVYVARLVAFNADTHEGGFYTTVEFGVIDPTGLGLDL